MTVVKKKAMPPRGAKRGRPAAAAGRGPISLKITLSRPPAREPGPDNDSDNDDDASGAEDEVGGSAG